MRTGLLGMVFSCLAGMGMAEEPTGLKALVTANDSRGWEAVGRLDIGGTGFCTGALIAPDIVLTAAHCLFDPETKKRVEDSEIQFLAGWRNGRATAYRAVRHSVLHDNYVYRGPSDAQGVPVDVALLALAKPIRNGSVTPFETGKRPRKGAQVGVVSYARNRATRPSLQEVCHVLGRPADTLIMSCDVDFGSSGAPVFVMDDGGEARIVSVISAKAEIGGRPVSLGARLDNNILAMRLRLEEGMPQTAVAEGVAPKVRKVSNGGRAGAKFLRP